MTLTICRATDSDIDAVLDLVTEAAQWLAEVGSDQWQYPAERHRLGIARTVARGEVWIVNETSGAVVATITLNGFADPEFWTEADGPSDALYAHRMAVARSISGNRIGTALLDWAARQAVDAGKKWLRLDAWATNSDLHSYYLGQGFENTVTLHLAHRGSGALFQRAATTQLGTGPRLIDQSAIRT